jgi:para-nitrobenzyl esterase
VSKAVSEPIVETAYGRVRGARRKGVCVFKGIRYGASTAGPNRFRPPQPPEPWPGIEDALDFGARAPQTDPQGRFRNPAAPGVVAPGLRLWRQAPAGDEAESEDCLFLNVWTPTLDRAAERPVLVWLHGGGFNALSSASPVYDGTRLARRRGVVVVTLNHRLGALGYTDLSRVCGDDFARSGNLGTLDVVAALRWVRENVERFGGDPGRVLLFGESGGGWKVSVALATLPAAGLFHRAAIQSGSALRVAEPDEADDIAERFLSTLGSPRGDTAALHAAPVERILAAQFDVEAQLPHRVVPNMIQGFVPVLDPEVLPAHPFEPVASSLSHDVPIVVGWNRTEMTLFAPEPVLDLSEAELLPRFAALVGDDADEAVAVYRARYPDASPARLYQYLHTDVTMLPFAPVIAERHADLGGAASYLYRLDWETPVLGGRLMSPHALEIALVFDTVAAAAALNGGGDRPQALADRMSGAWAAFAETGDPNAPAGNLPYWPAYESSARSTMYFDDESTIAAGAFAAETAIASRVVARLREERLAPR